MTEQDKRDLEMSDLVVFVSGGVVQGFRGKGHMKGTIISILDYDNMKVSMTERQMEEVSSYALKHFPLEL